MTFSRENWTSSSNKIYILPDQNFLLGEDISEYGKGSDIDDAIKSERESDATEGTKITEVPQ